MKIRQLICGLLTVLFVSNGASSQETFDRAALRPGHVMVSGHKLPGGGLAAVEVMAHGDSNPRDGNESGRLR